MRHLLYALSLAQLTCASLQVIPGATWTATNTGHHIQASAGGVFEFSGIYYMIGEDKTDGTNFQNINCYSSTDLVSWNFENAILTRTESGDLGPNRIIERPKIIYNDASSTYVLWMHIDNLQYSEAKVGVATSKSVCGNYNYIGSWNPLGHQSRDMGLFKDDDGSAYLLSEDRPNGLRIMQLTSDYLNVSAETYMWTDHHEAPAVLKFKGYYYMFASWLTGWSPNDNVYSWSKSMSGPWSPWNTFAKAGSNTYDSQTYYILPFGNTPIYMGDRYDGNNLMRSTYVWLPLKVCGSRVVLPDRDSWVPNVNNHTWSNPPASTKLEGENATLSGGAKIVSCSACSNQEAVGWIGGPSGGEVTFSGIQSSVDQQVTIRIGFTNGDTTERFARVSVNGVSQNIAFLPTVNGQSTGDSSLNCELAAGSSNKIVVQGLNGQYGPDIDFISVPLS